MRGWCQARSRPLGIPILGSIPRDESLSLPERHLGLVQAVEHGDLDARLERLAALAERHLDLDAILTLAAPPRLIATRSERRVAAARHAHRARARRGLHLRLSASARRLAQGGRRDRPLLSPRRRDAAGELRRCWLPGGYPELHAGRLAAAHRFRERLARFAATRKVHGECGGYMVLGESLEDADGVRHAMTGLARPRHELRRAQAPSRLSRGAAPRRRAARARRRARARA